MPRIYCTGVVAAPGFAPLEGHPWSYADLDDDAAAELLARDHHMYKAAMPGEASDDEPAAPRRGRPRKAD